MLLPAKNGPVSAVFRERNGTPVERSRSMGMDSQTLLANASSPLVASQVEQTLNDEIAALTEWIEVNGPYCMEERAHMKPGSRERAYWHYGYLVALRDTLAMLTKRPD